MTGVAWIIKSLKAFLLKRLIFYIHTKGYALGCNSLSASTCGLQPAYARRNADIASSLARALERHAIEGTNRPLRYFAFAKYAYPRFSLIIFAVKAAGIFCGSKKSPRHKNRNPPSRCRKIKILKKLGKFA